MKLWMRLDDEILQNNLNIYGFKKIEVNENISFQEYLEKVYKLLNKEIHEIDINKVREFLEKYEKYEIILTSVGLIKLKFAKLIEHIVALDRAVYLKENHISDVHIIKIFDEKLSNRNILIYASKN